VTTSGLAFVRAALVALVLATALGAGLSGCGKKGDLEPPEGRPSTYPRQYPTN
jgi:predicted small lipoprotein YifL